jgi:hypothetical protein
MADLNEAAELMQRWIDDEYAIETAIWTEPDEAKLQEMITRLNDQYYARGLSTRLQRGGRVDEAHLARGPQMLPGLGPRTLFRVERRAGPDGGPLFAAYVSSTRKGSKRLFSRYFLLPQEGGLRLVSQQNLCGECDGSGKVDGRTCPECGGSGWNQRGGMEIASPGAVEETKDFETPTDGWPA